jgi:hypothetical protein
MVAMLGGCAPGEPRAVPPGASTPGVVVMPAASEVMSEAPPASASADAKPPPPLPPYDLKADLEERTARAKASFGDDVSVSLDADVFLIVAADAHGGNGLGASIELTKNALGAYFHGRFDARPAKAVSVILFRTKDTYEAYCKARFDEACISPYGFYAPDVREIVMNAAPGLGTLTHELIHPIVETDFPKAPIWINEGIASLFEQPEMPRAGEIHGGKNWRWPHLIAGLDAADEKDKVTLPALFALSDDAFRGDAEKLHYAMARYFCQWLDSRGQLWPFYRSFRDHVADDPTGEKAFVAVVGKTPAEMNDEWTRWVRAL